MPLNSACTHQIDGHIKLIGIRLLLENPVLKLVGVDCHGNLDTLLKMTPSPSMKGKKAIYDEQMGVCLDRYLVVEDECSSLDSVSMPTSSAARLMTTTSNKTSHFHRRSIEDSRKQVPIGLVGSQKKLDKLEMRPPPSSVKSVQSSKFEAKSCSSANKPSVQTTIEASSVGVQVTGDMTIETSGEREPGESNMSTASLDDTEKQRNSEVVNTQPQVSEGVGDDSKRAGSSEMKADDQRRNEVELPEQAVDLRPPSLPPSPSTVSELPASENKSQPAESIECTVDPTVQQLSSTPTTSEMEKVTMAAHVVGNHDLARVCRKDLVSNYFPILGYTWLPTVRCVYF